ncbi:unannotated protein [freshwater metagenome]|uniref:Unannotated protein n=1 Tax=freshwater metagenome TaxID=449393 RepID=A0A6J6Z7S0_9ZZZZ
MGLPSVNPIDCGWLPRGTPIDPLGRNTIPCRACGGPQEAEWFRIILGRYGGFGAPVYVVPFLKRQSTSGKVGARASFAQCTKCLSLWPGDEEARALLAKNGFDPVGMVFPAALQAMLNREAAKRDENASRSLPGVSKVRKLPPE